MLFHIFPYFVFLCSSTTTATTGPLSRQRPSTAWAWLFQIFVSCYQAPKECTNPLHHVPPFWFPSFEALANTQEEEEKPVLSFSLLDSIGSQWGQREDCMEDRGLKMECMSITAILEKEEEEWCPQGRLAKMLLDARSFFLPFFPSALSKRRVMKQIKKRSFLTSYSTYAFFNVLCVCVSCHV